jgi:membrane-bound serine protease (ClpP class)
MKHFLQVWLALMMGCAFGFAEPAAQPGKAVVIPIHGEISDAQFFFLRRALKEAETEKAQAVVLDIDTYGGSLSAAVDMLNALFKSSVPSYAYINTNAGSAGALIALCAKKIYMAPVSAIGAAAPVLPGGQELSPTMADKTTSYFSGYFRSAAERNGHNPDIAEAFIRKEKEVKVGETLVHPKGSLLTFSAQEATKMVDGKPLLAAGIANSVDDLLEKAGLPGCQIVKIHPTGFEQLALWITLLSPLFLLGGIVCAYIEIKIPGFGIFGVLSILCFGIFFAGHYIAGLAGWEVAALFAIGLALVLSELMLHPGTVIPGVLGAMMVLAAVLWAMIDRYPNQPFVPTTQMLFYPAINLGIAVVLASIAISILAKYLPQVPLFNRLVLSASNAKGPSFSLVTPNGSSAPGRSRSEIRVGDLGVASSILRPTGNAHFGDTLLDVVTRGEFVEPGSKLKVLAVEGARIVVEKLEG